MYIYIYHTMFIIRNTEIVLQCEGLGFRARNGVGFDEEAVLYTVHLGL